MTKKLILALYILLAAASHAQESNSVFNFLEMPVSAHSTALGGRNISLIEDDASLVFSNPALLSSVSDKTLNLNFMTFGGGYSMISLIQGQVVTQYHWMTMQEFTDVVAISQMTPGPIGINTATYCGYTAVHNAGMSGMMAVLGSAMATFALVLPSLVLMILISKMLYKYMNTSAVQSIFIGLRPAIVGLVGAAALLLMNGENFSTPANPWHFYISIALFFATFIGVKVMKINPIRMILYSAFAGLVLLY